jgi:hypothetical protein
MTSCPVRVGAALTLLTTCTRAAISGGVRTLLPEKRVPSARAVRATPAVRTGYG